MLLFTNQLYGPFKQITEHDDRYECTGLTLFKTVVGTGIIIDPLLPDGFRADCYTWDGENLVKVKDPDPIPEPVPEQITPRQCRLQLLAEGKLDDVEAAINTMGQAAKIDWEYAEVIKRDYPLVAAMMQLFQWTDADADAFFIAAAKL